MIAIIRITGQINLTERAKETLSRLRLRKKYKCVVVREKPETMGMIKKVRNFIAYGKIDKATFVELINKRGKVLDNKKIDAEKIADEFINSKTDKKLSEFGIKPFFSLHPARGGIKSKLHYPRGVLGNHKDKINDLIKRML